MKHESSLLRPTREVGNDKHAAGDSGKAVLMDKLMDWSLQGEKEKKAIWVGGEERFWLGPEGVSVLYLLQKKRFI